jgi:L-asparaginase
MTNKKSMGKIVVLTTGGTIASAYDKATGAVQASLNVTDLLGGLDATDLPPVEGRNIISKNSASLTLADAILIVTAIAEACAREDVAGVVVTHGTDTLEETAFLADLLIAPGKPVVFTGAQAAADEIDRDGPRNLADSIRVAAHAPAHGAGVLIVFDGDILTARDATKRHAARRYTFVAPSGPIGDIDQGIVRLTRRPATYQRFAEMKLAEPVDLVTLTLGGGERLLKLVADASPKGLVLAATGRGNATPGIVEIVRQLVAKQVPVLVTSRSPQGRVAPIYGQGGGADLQKAGAILAGDLSGPKARLLLAVILGQSARGDIAARIASVAFATIAPNKF